MKQAFCIIVASLMIGLPTEPAAGVTISGSNGLLRVQSANNVYRGDLWGSVNMGYTQKGPSTGSFTFRNGTGSIDLIYGIRHYLEVGINQTIYQDRAFSGAGPAVGPLRISVKGALPTNAPSSINIGGQFLLTVPIGGASNVEWQSYISPSPSIGGMLILSFDSNPVFLNRSRRFHINVGFISHNDRNKYEAEEVVQAGIGILNIATTNGKNSSQAFFGAGLQVPIRDNIGFFTELTGERFININSNTIIAKEGSSVSTHVRLTPGIQHELTNQFSLLYGLDLRPTSVGRYAAFDNQAIYPRWKAFLNLQYRILEGVPPTYRRGRSMRVSGRSYYQYGRGGDLDPLGVGRGVIQNLEAREELLNQAERELDEIRQQRIKAQRELEEMKNSMEEDPKK